MGSKKLSRKRLSVAQAKALRRTVIGWREWVRLPQLELPSIKAKIDTGARTSALHAFRIRPYSKKGVEYVEFFVHPLQRRRAPEIRCEAKVLDRRSVTSSSGHRELRYVIETQAQIGDNIWAIELTLANRDELGFRMLIGREALRGRFLIDASRSYYFGAG